MKAKYRNLAESVEPHFVVGSLGVRGLGGRSSFRARRLNIIASSTVASHQRKSVGSTNLRVKARTPRRAQRVLCRFCFRTRGTLSIGGITQYFV
jgi:hypothetical protein